MKAVTATVLLVTLGAVALAKPIPVERPSLALAHSDISISLVGATLEERAYFQASQPSVNASGFPCRLEPAMFDKARLAQWCR